MWIVLPAAIVGALVVGAMLYASHAQARRELVEEIRSGLAERASG